MVASLWQSVLLWTLFLVTSVYGHVALKIAADRGQGGMWGKVVSGALTVWGVTALVSWSLSSVFWMMLLGRTELARANSLSSIRYVLISLAAWACLGEKLTPADGVGIALIAAGLVLIGRG